MLNARAHYSEQEIAAIFSHLRSMSEDGKGKVLDAIFGAAAGLNLDLHYRKRPTGGQIQAALDPIQRQAAALQRLLAELDDDSQRALLISAGEWQDEADIFQSNHFPQQFPEFGRDTQRRQRVRIAGQALDALASWSAAAIKANPPSPPGKTKLEAEREAVAAILPVWSKWRPPGMERSVPNFKPFVRASLDPILIQYFSEPPDLDGVIRDVWTTRAKSSEIQ